MKKHALSAAVLGLAVSLGAPAFAQMKDMDMNAKSENQQRIEATGKVNQVMTEDNKVVLTHGPIPEMGWPAMKMGFPAADNVDLEALQEGDEVRFVFEPAGGRNEIVEIEKKQ